jgi:hypothetical protein
LWSSAFSDRIVLFDRKAWKKMRTRVPKKVIMSTLNVGDVFQSRISRLQASNGIRPAYGLFYLQVVTVDIVAGNDVIHVIDSAIMPPSGKKTASKGKKKYSTSFCRSVGRKNPSNCRIFLSPGRNSSLTHRRALHD